MEYMTAEKAISKMRAYDLDKHFDDEYVQIVKNVMDNTKYATIKGDLEIEFFAYMETYTGGKRNFLSFIELINGALEEIEEGLYKFEDRDLLYNKLCELEWVGVSLYFRSIWGTFQPSLKKIYTKGTGYFEEKKINVPLRKYRNMRYSMLQMKEELLNYRKYTKELEEKIEQLEDK